MALDNHATALAVALRSFGEELGRALAEGITRGVQEGLSRSLDLEELAERMPLRAAEGVAASLAGPRPAARRGGRPRGEVRACRVAGCADPARSRGLCSRHYQQELRRENSGGAPAPAPAPVAPVEARPPIVRKRAEAENGIAPGGGVGPQVVAVPPAPVVVELPAESAEKASDLARRIFGNAKG